MVSYSFNFRGRFAPAILDGSKGGTIRGDRKRHARPGEELQLYEGLRSPRCRLVARKTCLAVERVELDFRANRQRAGRVILGPLSSPGFFISRPDALRAFARFDGFETWDDMREFWARQHQTSEFTGWHIRWLPMPEECQ